MQKDSEAKRIRIDITIDPKLLEWLQEGIEYDRFGSISHGINKAVRVLKALQECI